MFSGWWIDVSETLYPHFAPHFVPTIALCSPKLHLKRIIWRILVKSERGNRAITPKFAWVKVD